MSSDRAPSVAIFDLGGVLIDVSLEAVYRHWAGSAGLTEEQVAERLTGDAVFEAFERGEVSAGQVYRHVADRLGGGISVKQVAQGWNSMLGGTIEGVEDLLAGLSGRVRLAMLSNTNEAHADFIFKAHRELLRHFEKVFVSHQMGTRKPEPACFGMVLDDLGVAPTEAVFIDDKPAYVEAARSLGMRGIVAESPAQIAACLGQMGVHLDG